MDQAEIKTIVTAFSEVIKEHFPTKMIILFGSYAKGNQRSDSDIDIAVVLEKIDGDFLESQTKLFKLRRDIDFRIEPLLIDESEDKTGFLEEIQKTGLIIYQTT